MHTHQLHPPTPLLHNRANRLHALGELSRATLRYVVLSTLACFFFSTPISFREVSHVSHRSAPRT